MENLFNKFVGQSFLCKGNDSLYSSAELDNKNDMDQK